MTVAQATRVLGYQMRLMMDQSSYAISSFEDSEQVVAFMIPAFVLSHTCIESSLGGIFLKHSQSTYRYDQGMGKITKVVGSDKLVHPLR